ncbi:MAG: type II toxin-antitoxin system HicB family antitoxin [Candidatus Hydrogenedentes bacterium]|nr:type II toxin-antitoxin system HicB family antitoxin [Candidatus Hydrogenedentota bacterium]
MSDTLTYKGYQADIQFSADDECFFGTVSGLKDTITFEGQSVKELKRAFEESVDFYLAMCKKRGEAPEKPYNGKVLLRVPTELHRSIAIAAKRAGTSVNSYIVGKLSEAAQR